MRFCITEIKCNASNQKNLKNRPAWIKRKKYTAVLVFYFFSIVEKPCAAVSYTFFIFIIENTSTTTSSGATRKNRGWCCASCGSGKNSSFCSCSFENREGRVRQSTIVN